MESVILEREDGTIDVLQRVPATSKLEPAQLERLYWDEIRRLTLGAMRFSRDGIRVAGLWPVVLRFGPLVDSRRQIVGGMFARRAGGTIGWQADGEHTSVSVEGFAPLLRGPLWRVEAWFHALVARRFLARATREGN